MNTISRGRALGTFFFLVIVGFLALIVFRPGSESAAAVTLGDPNAWVEHGIDGELLRVNALTGEINTRIEVADPGDAFVAYPHGDGAVVLNTTSSVVSLVSGSQLEVTSTIEVALSDGAASRNPALFGSDSGIDEVLVVDDDQIIAIEGSTGDTAPTALEAPISSAVQDEAGAVFGLDRSASTVTRVLPSGISPVAAVSAAVDPDDDQRQVISSGGRIFVLDPARLSLNEVLPSGVLGDPVCMRSIANGAVHGGSGPDEEPLILSLNAAASRLAISSADGTCRDVDVDVDNGDYSAPLALNGVAYLPFWEEGRIITIDLDTGETLGEMTFGTRGEPFELEIFGDAVWANERLGPFAAVVGETELTPVPKISAVLAVSGTNDGSEGNSLFGGGDDGTDLRLLGDTGAAVIAADGGDETGAGEGTSTDANDELAPAANSQIPQPEAFGIAIDPSALATVPEEEPEVPELTETLFANFSVSAVEVIVGEVVRFTDSSLGSPIAWSWTFGDGDISDQPDVDKVWTEPGLYDITLTVTNAAGESSSQSTQVNVVPETVVLPPDADFQFSNDTIEEGESVTFESRSTGDPDLLEWDFGNGSSAVGEEVTHTFEDAGTYEVVLSASNEAGATTSSVTITVLAGVEPPIAAIAAFPSVVVTDQTVTFESASLNEPTRITWGFGDGQTATGQSVRHAWTEPGEYRIVLAVENSEGTDRTVADITVEQRVIPPVSSFTQSDTEVLVGETVSFTDASLNNPDRYTWDFADGTNSSQPNPTKAWDTPGTYRVTLRATNDAGTDRTGVTITVVEPVDPPVASFTVNSRTVAVGQDLIFRDTSTNEPTSWFWEFGNGTSSDPNPFRRWDSAGTYTVRLTAANEGGSSTSEIQVRVFSPPTASFRFEMVDDNTVRFIDQSQNATEWNWDFGDGARSNQQNPTHEFDSGVYEVTLRTSNDAATAGPSRQTVTISNPPVAEIDCNANGSLLVCTSDGSRRAVSFQWSADGAVENSNPNGASTTFQFNNGGRKQVTLVVTNAEGLTDTATIRSPRVTGGEEPSITNVRVDSVDGDLVRLVADFEGEPNSWQWQIDNAELVDGGNSSTPTFRVSTNGTFTGSVRASNTFGADTDPVEFTVNPFETIADFSWEVVEPGVVRFTNQSSWQGDVNFEWRFNGPTEVLDGNEQQPVVRYPDSGGSFRVVLVVNADSGRDVARIDIDVPAVEPEPEPEPDPDDGDPEPDPDPDEDGDPNN